jgi:methionine-rich copper-binding protein CopC
MRIVICLFIVSVLLNPALAHAHTGLIQSIPANGATVYAELPALELIFGAQVRLISLQIIDSEGESIKREKTRDLTPAKRFQIALPALVPGDYKVNWVVMGGDSHKMSGQFGFAVRSSTEQ